MPRFLALLVIYLLFPHPVRAVTLTLTNLPPSIGEDEFAVTASVSGASSGTNYLRLDLYQEGTTNYFGETDNGSYWYSDSDGKQYAPLTIASGSGEVVLRARLGEPSLTEYPGPGVYKLRLRRYTSSGNQASNDTQTPQNITITKSWPSPSPSPTPQPSPSPSPTPLISSPPPSPPPTPTPTPKPSPSPLVSPSPSAAQVVDQLVGTVAGETTASAFTDPLESTSPSTPSAPRLTLRRDRVLSVILIISGLLLLSVSGYILYRRQYGRHDKLDQ